MPIDLRPLPIPVQDPALLPPLIYAETAWIRCLPFVPIRYFASPGQLPDSPAPYDPWDMAIETHWRKIHPRVWEILEEDDRKDCEEYARIGDEFARVSKEGTVTEEDSLKVAELQTQLRDRIIMRSSRLLGLHLARNAVFALETARKPGLALGDFLRALPVGDYDRFAESRPGSLWPLPSVPPPRDKLTLVTLHNYGSYMVSCYPSKSYNVAFGVTDSKESTNPETPVVPRTWTPPSPPDEKHLESQRLLRRRMQGGEKED